MQVIIKIIIDVIIITDHHNSSFRHIDTLSVRFNLSKNKMGQSDRQQAIVKIKVQKHNLVGLSAKIKKNVSVICKKQYCKNAF